MSDIAARGYANPSVLVSTDWVAEHKGDPDIRVIESNEDQLLYPSGHIPGAVQVDWAADLNDQLRRDYLDKAGFEDIIRSRPAIAEEMAAILAERNMQLAQAQEALGAEAREHERSRQHASLLGKMRAFFRLGEK